MPRLTATRAAQLLTAAAGNLTRAANAAGVERDALRRLLGLPETRGRPAAEIDAALVARLRAERVPEGEIARWCGVGKATLRRVCPRRKDRG